ncbi:Uncharacterised protein [Bordetella pertussis]|nr:Uncharacterised protein [Bordetella pertussis]
MPTGRTDIATNCPCCSAAASAMPRRSSCSALLPTTSVGVRSVRAWPPCSSCSVSCGGARSRVTRPDHSATMRLRP